MSNNMVNCIIYEVVGKGMKKMEKIKGLSIKEVENRKKEGKVNS